jgi:predicted RNase H-like nuclease (RuvC/YqgF family)
MLRRMETMSFAKNGDNGDAKNENVRLRNKINALKDELKTTKNDVDLLKGLLEEKTAHIVRDIRTTERYFEYYMRRLANVQEFKSSKRVRKRISKEEEKLAKVCKALGLDVNGDPTPVTVDPGGDAPLPERGKAPMYV